MSEDNISFSVDKTISSGKSTIILINSLKERKKYALKIYPNDSNSHTNFHQEQRIHSSLSHPNIIKHFSNQSLPFSQENFRYNVIAMEYAPYGDFFKLVLENSFADEKLVRSYFHQLIEGLEYLHSQNVAHLDIKLENLFMGEDFLLKIADFDLAEKFSEKNSLCPSRGTANYRSQEILSNSCYDYRAADIYSVGICLYALYAGAFPFIEEEEGQNKILFRYDTFIENNEEFWRENQDLMKGRIVFSDSFKDLINRMWTKKPEERITLEEIKNSRWYNEPIYTHEELKEKMQKILID